ncbi:M16 family metallopeptidase [Aureispira anguillae]|uniref:Insulinase family protein n=1 Tax=Aureispira anguillae TaxID=2864201 RepID=A0A915YKB9_9BACT|nr:M16 family metallopeptidase [Aureispira anguillae]BDS14542.1 insulinase family protein [Aureispira anguillae]
MNNASKFLALFLFVLLGYAEMGCKSSSDTTSNNKTKTKETVAKSDTTTPSPISGLGSLGSTATTDDAKEGASGMDAKLPFSPDVRTGVLDNGMHYYIRKNAQPENRIELRLAVDAGSMQEDDDQQGLAHFVEHMAFNGTTNFAKNDLINFLEKTGVRFGADLNAYTSFDETVYMLQLPTDKEGLVDKGLLVMSDWATGIAFEAEEIDKERGVIQSEWRTGLGANERMRHVWWPKVFYKTRYADRLPIGLMDIIQNAPHDRFRRFYRDWYRPNLQAIIVVGDLDVDEMEKKIKEKFQGLKNPENPREKKLFEVPDHDETFVAIATDKEATGIQLQLYTKHAPQKINTLGDYRTSLMHQLYNSMLSSRFDEIGQQNDAPFISAGAGYGNFVRSKDGYFSSARCKEDGILGSLDILLRENQRVLQHGFTDTELERQKLALEKLAERQYKERDKSTSNNLAMECVYHFLNDAPLFGAEKELKLVKEFLPSITLEEINALAKNWIIEKNRAIVLTAPEKESIKMPTEAEIRKILAASKEFKTEPYKDKFVDMPLLAKTPTAGKVVDTKKVEKDELGLTEYTLSNGVRVILKPTEFKNDQILLTAYSPGGHSLYDDKDFTSAQNAANIIDQAGLGEFDLIALEKKLTGATVSIAPYIGELYEGFSGSSSVEDFETMLQLVHLYGTKPRKDRESFDRVIDQSKEQLRNLSANPMLYFQSEIQKIKTGNHPRRKAVPSEEDISKIDFERVHEIYNDRFSDFSDFTFVLVGNIDPEKVKPQLELYLGSLPSTNRKEKGKDVGVKYPTAASTNNLKKGLAPQANVYMGFVQEEEWSQEKAHRVASMSKVLSIMVRENLREDKGGVYSPYVGGRMSKEPKGTSDVTVFFQCAPEDVETLVEAVKEEIKSLQENGPSDENFNKVRETQRRSRESNLEKNRFWLSTLSSYYRTDRDLEGIKAYDNLIENLTKEDIQKAAKQFLDLEKSIIVTVKPEKEAPKGP